MPVTISCGCGKVLKAPDTAIGKKVRCPGCGSALSVEAPLPSPPAPAAIKQAAPPQEAPAKEVAPAA